MHVCHQTAGVRKSPRDGKGQELQSEGPRLCHPWGEAPSGPSSPVPSLGASVSVLAAGPSDRTPSGFTPGPRPPRGTWVLTTSCPHSHRLAGSLVASALFLHSVLLAGPVQSPPSFATGRRAGPRLLCSLTPRSARSHALPASPALKNRPRQ